MNAIAIDANKEEKVDGTTTNGHAATQAGSTASYQRRWKHDYDNN
jgi:hypothetical protein